VKFLLLTGARRTEAARMTWSEISGADWTLPAARNKVKVDLIRPLSAAAQATIAQLPRIGRQGFVFTNGGDRPIRNFSKSKRRLDRAAGVTGWTLHDLRRTARSLMSRAGVLNDHAERCLGHVMGGVRGTYDPNEFLEEKRRAFEAHGSNRSPAYLQGVLIDRPRHGRLQAHSLMPREYGVELSGVWIEPSHNGKRTAPELKSSPMIFSYQPAPNARQPGLSFARHASRAVIVAQLNEPGG